MTAAWPWPGDSPLAIARKIAIAYRTRLHAARPDLCEQLDAQATAWGQTWVTPSLLTVPDDDVLTARQAADYLGVSLDRIRQLRLAGRLPGTPDGRTWLYRVDDLRGLVAKPRRRQPRV